MLSAEVISYLGSASADLLCYVVQSGAGLPKTLTGHLMRHRDFNWEPPPSCKQ